MKREIKFRAYTHDNRMVYESFYSYFGSYGCVFNQFECEPKDLMQFTGLKDKNDNPIYEGDILETEGIVAWNDIEHRWSVIDLEWNDRREWHDIDYTTVPLEVIGNIHENKDLL